MPFTLAHPAAALPLRRYAPGMLLPLAIGCLAPDLPYYLPESVAEPWSHAGHGWPGIYTISVPLGIAVVVLLVVCRHALLAPLWGAHRIVAARLVEEFLAVRGRWWRAALAVLLGVYLHVGWDAFTHAGGAAVRWLPLLREPVALPGRSMPLYHVLQYASSVLGLAALAATWWRAASRVPPAAAARHAAAWRPALLAGIAACSGAVGYAELAAAADRSPSLYTNAGLFLVDAVAAFCVAYLVAGVCAALVERRTGAATG